MVKKVCTIADMVPGGAFPFHMGFFTLNSSYPRHGHDFVELTIVLEGRAEHVIRRERYPICAGDVYVINKNVEHSLENPVHFHHCNVMFYPEALKLPLRDLAHLRGYKALFELEPYYRSAHAFGSRLHLGVDQMKIVHAMLAALLREYKGRASGRELILRSRLTELIVHLAREYEASHAPQARQIFRIAGALSHMESHYCDDLSVSALAKQAGLSERHFARLFMAYYQVTPLEYILRLRLQKATELLADRSRSVTEVAFACGFNDGNYFTRKFTQSMGMPPRRFREGLLRSPAVAVGETT